ncbi:MAG: hypothetical protein NHB15_08635 [Methanosarcina barkeri]|nr:hypothetical protein [Methanosarcina sp. ERenArc_MAG2]
MPFNFENLRLPPTFEIGPVAKKLITTIPVRKPRGGLDFFRIRPESEWTFATFLVDLQEGEEEKYLVAPEFIDEVLSNGKLKPAMIYTGITYIGQILFLSDIPLPDSDGKDNEYNRSRRLAYEIAKKKWIKIRANKALGAYEIIGAVGELPEPVWPEEIGSIEKALEIAFKGKLIDSYNHPVLKRLRGSSNAPSI